MNNNTDTIRSFLLGLLEHFSRTVSSPSGKVADSNETLFQASQLSSSSESSSEEPAGYSTFPVNESSSSTFSNDLSIEMPPLSELGEMPAVQDHFQTVLKRRLQIEVDQKPPLFPWESSLQDYPIELSTTAVYPWLVQLQSLRLPTELPEEILSSLLSRCQEIVLESLQPGVSLVKAVETVFAEEPAMNQIAGLVLAGAFRSSATRDLDLKDAFPDGYEGASSQQQVTLAMLAAKDIMDALTITLTPQAPVAQREWLTTEGKIILTARYQGGPPHQVDLSIELPQASQVTLSSTGQTLMQDQPGTLTLSLQDPLENVIYPLEIEFSDRDSMPLNFAICWSKTAE